MFKDNKKVVFDIKVIETYHIFRHELIISYYNIYTDIPSNHPSVSQSIK